MVRPAANGELSSTQWVLLTELAKNSQVAHTDRSAETTVEVNNLLAGRESLENDNKQRKSEFLSINFNANFVGLPLSVRKGRFPKQCVCSEFGSMHPIAAQLSALFKYFPNAVACSEKRDDRRLSLK